MSEMSKGDGWLALIFSSSSFFLSLCSQYAINKFKAQEDGRKRAGGEEEWYAQQASSIYWEIYSKPNIGRPLRENGLFLRDA